MIFFLVFFSGLIKNSLENINDYYQYTVITKIESVNEISMTLPAVTLCLFSLKNKFTNATLDKTLYNCSISGTVCESKDFYSFETRSSEDDIMTCFVLNGGRNSTDHSIEIKSITYPNYRFFLGFYLPNDHSIYHYINDAFVKPTPSEITKYLLPARISNIILEKTIETKLEFPFNDCLERKNLPDNHLVRQLSSANITYRQVNCFELCLQNFIKMFALEHGISKVEARLKTEVNNFNKEKNCKHSCPLECDSTHYKMSESTFSTDDFSNIEDSILQNKDFIEKKKNITINSSEEFNKNILQIQVYFDSLKYTKINQTPKTS